MKLSFTVAMLDAFPGRIVFCYLYGKVFGLGVFGYFLGYIIGTYVTATILAVYYFNGPGRRGSVSREGAGAVCAAASFSVSSQTYFPPFYYTGHEKGIPWEFSVR